MRKERLGERRSEKMSRSADAEAEARPGGLFRKNRISEQLQAVERLWKIHLDLI